MDPKRTHPGPRPLTIVLIVGMIALVAFLAYRIGQRNEMAAPAPAGPMQSDSMGNPAQTPAVTRMNPQPAADPPPMTPEMIQQVMRERAADLDQNFNEDPRDPAWAAATENKIDKVIASVGSLDQLDYGITAQDVECRSHGCMINITFPNDDAADGATMSIRRALISDFNQTLTVPVRGPDGTVQYRMYSVAPDHGDLLRKRRPDTTQASTDNPRR